MTNDSPSRQARAQPMLDFRQLRYFAHIAEVGSFSQAARNLSVAQPALSHHIATLEAQLGVRVFLRTSRGVALTRDGERLLGHARAILGRLARAEDEMSTNRTPLSGPPVAVGLIPSLSGYFAVPMLERLREKFPDFRIRLLDGLSDQIVEWLLAGEIQLGFSTLGSHPRRLTVDPIVHQSLCLVAAPGIVKRRSATIPFEEAVRLPLILNPRPNSVRTALETAAKAQGLDLNLWLEFDAYAVIKEAIRKGFGCSVLSWGSVAEECAAGSLVAYRLVNPSVARPLQLISVREHALSRPARILKEEILRLSTEFVAEKRFQ